MLRNRPGVNATRKSPSGQNITYRSEGSSWSGGSWARGNRAMKRLYKNNSQPCPSFLASRAHTLAGGFEIRAVGLVAHAMSP